MILHQVIDDQRADRHFRSDIKKDAQRTETEPWTLQQVQSGQPLTRFMLFALQRVAEQPDRTGDDGERNRNPQIAVNNRLALRRAIGVKLDARQLVGGDRCQAAENEDRTDIGKYGRSQRIKRLGKCQPAMRCGRLAEERYQWVGNNLHNHHAARQHEQGEQEHAIGGRLARRNKQQAACHHRQQPDDSTAHVADFLDQPCARNADNGICGKEAELHQHGLRIIEREQLFELWNDHIVQAGDPAEDEKQTHDKQLQLRRIDMCAVGLRRRCGACR